MHKILKYFYLEGKKTKRLDKGVHALMKYIRDKIIDRLIKNVKGKANSHTKNIIMRHTAAVNCSFDINNLENNSWLVTGTNDSYCITKKQEDICCRLICLGCNICIHSYNCTCVDYFIHSTICKHIHAVCILVKNKSTTDKITLKSDSEVQQEISDHLLTLSQNSSTLSSSNQANSGPQERLVTKIKLEINKLDKSIEEVQNVEVLSHVLKTVANENILVKVETGVSFPKVQTKEPSNKKIDKQLTFFSTKKRNLKKKHIFVKPSSEESSDIKQVIQGNTEVIINDSRLDHSYI